MNEGLIVKGTAEVSGHSAFRAPDTDSSEPRVHALTRLASISCVSRARGRKCSGDTGPRKTQLVP